MNVLDTIMELHGLVEKPAAIKLPLPTIRPPTVVGSAEPNSSLLGRFGGNGPNFDKLFDWTGTKEWAR